MAQQKTKIEKRSEVQKEGWLEGQEVVPALKETRRREGGDERSADEPTSTEEKEGYKEDLPSSERMGERVEKFKKKE